MDYHLIKFNAGEGVDGVEGYQVVDNGMQVSVTDLNGNILLLPLDYSFDFTKTFVPAPVWASANT